MLRDFHSDSFVVVHDLLYYSTIHKSDICVFSPDQLVFKPFKDCSL